MEAKIEKRGDSYVLRIPKSLALELGMDIGAKVKLEKRLCCLRVIPPGVKHYSLEELLKSVPDDYEPEEWDTGPPVGKEVCW